jgi:hypothetical protein
VPVERVAYLNQLKSPVPLAALAQDTSTMADPGPIYTSLIASVDCIGNRDFVATPPHPRFVRFVAPMTQLTRSG